MCRKLQMPTTIEDPMPFPVYFPFTLFVLDPIEFLCCFCRCCSYKISPKIKFNIKKMDEFLRLKGDSATEERSVMKNELLASKPDSL